jgi:hypothetical protein
MRTYELKSASSIQNSARTAKKCVDDDLDASALRAAAADHVVPGVQRER